MQKIRFAMAAGATLLFASVTAGAQLPGRTTLPRTTTSTAVPAGMCQIWIDGVPANRQPAPTTCEVARARVPANGRIIYGNGAQRTTGTVYGQQSPVYGTNGTYDPRRDPRNAQYDPRLDRRNSRYDRRYEDEYNRKQAKLREQYLKKQQKEREKYERKMEKAREQDARADVRGTGIGNGNGNGKGHGHGHGNGNGGDHDHDHDHDHHDHTHTETISLEQKVLEKNDLLAERNRQWLAGRGILALNVTSSPGAGKTTLLERTIRELTANRSVAVIEGDQETLLDAERIRAAGARAVQVNTGAGCHLDADMVHRALHALGPESGSLLFIENVGNLVCPALFDLGEHSKVVVISVTEGADKPLKYPHMFAAAGLVIINKIDLMPYVDFDLEKCAGYARSVNPGVNILPLSATTGEGVQAWYEWIASQARPSANADMSQVSVDKTNPPE